MPRMLTETHRIATVDEVDSIKLYITPILERLHRISPSTDVKHSFDVAADGAILVHLSVGQESYTAHQIIKTRALFERMERIVENYINANKGSDGCAICGAGPKQPCITECEVLEAELCLSSLRHVIAQTES